MTTKLTDVREELMATLKALRDPAQPLSIEVAKAVVSVAQVMIDSARVEVEMVKAVEAVGGSDFFSVQTGVPQIARQPVRN